MRNLRASITLIIVIVAPILAPAAWAQTPPHRAPTLHVSGLGAESTTLSQHDLDAMPRIRASVVSEKGEHVTYEGVPIIEILRRVGAPSGNDMRGKQMTLYVLVSASDGYHAVYALAELDPNFTDKQVLLVDRRDGKDLSAAEGPFRIIAPGEKRHARWVHNVTSLALRNAQ